MRSNELIIVLSLSVVLCTTSCIAGMVSIGLKAIRANSKAFKQVQEFMKNISLVGGSAEISLRDVQDTYYYGAMTIGNPAQTLNVLFDSGSSDLWVPSNQICQKNLDYCQRHPTYDAKLSSTYRKDGQKFKIIYGSGAVSGFVSQDSIMVADLQVTNQLFGEATNIDSDTASSLFDGIFGLAFPALSTIQTNPPFVNMIEQGAVDHPVFAFYFNKKDQSSSDSANLVLGGVDPAHYTGDFTYTPVTEATYWKIQIDSLLLNSQTVVSSFSAIPDSGTSFFYGPTKYMNIINKAIGGKLQDGIHLVDCFTTNSLPNITVVISGTPFVLLPEDYILKASDGNSELCFTGFGSSDKIQFFILGDVFMRKYYTVFDMGKNQVGFARASANRMELTTAPNAQDKTSTSITSFIIVVFALFIIKLYF